MDRLFCNASMRRALCWGALGMMSLVIGSGSVVSPDDRDPLPDSRNDAVRRRSTRRRPKAGNRWSRARMARPGPDRHGVASPLAADEGAQEGKIPVSSLLQIFSRRRLLMYPIALCHSSDRLLFERHQLPPSGRVIPRRSSNASSNSWNNSRSIAMRRLSCVASNPSPIAQIFSAALRR